MGVAADYVSRTKIGAYFHSMRESRKLILFIVAVALLLDNMLLTIVVPIIPEFLYSIRHQHDHFTTPRHRITTTTTTTPQTPFGFNETNYGDPAAPFDFIVDESNDDIAPTYSSNDEYQDYGEIEESKLTPEQKIAWENEKRRKHAELMHETVEVGVMFASKAVVQLITNPFIGPLTNRIGYSIPMFTGFVIMFLSTLIFAFSRSYAVLFFARALQGVGSSCSSVSGMGMLAERFPDDEERGNAMGIALGGLAMGVLIGPPFGGFMYQFVGKSAPFIVLSMLALLDGCLQLCVLQPKVVKSEEEAPSLGALIKDPYILIAAGAITFANMGIAMLEPSLPIFMMDQMDAEKWQLGAAFLPASISYLIGTNLFGPLGHRMGRWLASFIGLSLIGLALIFVPFATRPNHLIIPMAALGFGIGMVDSSMMPQLGYLVDIRHGNVYGGVYAIGDIAFCLGFAVGPALSGSLVQHFGFKAMMVGIGIISFFYGPLLFLLKDPPPRTEQDKQETTHLVFGGEKVKVKYANFDEELMQPSQFNTPPTVIQQQHQP
jgi:DHA1 family solute carrier family 18 vesicular amine transporter 1/2